MAWVFWWDWERVGWCGACVGLCGISGLILGWLCCWRGGAAVGGCVDEVDECADVVDGRGGEYAVAEVEDMSGSSAGVVEDAARLLANDGDGSEQDGGVEVSLHGDVVAEAIPGEVEWDAPVESDDVAAGVALVFEEGAGVGAEVDGGDVWVELREQAFHVGLDEAEVMVGCECSDPAIEELECLCAGVGLRVQVEDGGVDEPFHEGVPGAWVLEEEGFSAVVVS